MDFISGKYTLRSKRHLMNLIDEMTVREKRQILEWDFIRLSADLWGGGAVEHHAQEKFATLKAGVSVEGDMVRLEDLVTASPTRWETPEWGFPKGRRNVNESDLACALREYEEETGFSRKNVQLISNLLPYEEVFIGSNYKAYKHKYYVAFNLSATPETLVQCNEVSDMRLFTYEEAMQTIRPYNTERKQVLDKVHTMITTFF
jgi:8-oxo-dGTP pyrophosphatase MutT (NUDIX family)